MEHVRKRGDGWRQIAEERGVHTTGFLRELLRYSEADEIRETF